jgi:hypothetical protein
MWAKQSTAATLIVGPILDSTGAEYTSAVIGDLSISKNGGTLTAMASAATLTHIANGQYTLVTTTGNLDTLGRAQITCNKSTYQMPTVNLMVVPANVYDSMVLGTDALDVSAIQFAGQTITAAAGVTVPSSIASPTNITSASGITLAATTHTGAVIPTVSSVTNGVTVTTNNDKTGYSLSQSFPSNFASLGINASGHISRVVLVDTTSAVTGLTASNLDAAVSSRLAPTVSGRTLDVTATGAAGIDWGNIENQGSQVVLYDTSIQNVTSVDQTDSVISLAAGATISGGVDDEIAAAVAATQALSRLDSMIESDGAGQFRYDTIALSMAAGGGGGGTDWTANERTAIRSILGFDSSGTVSLPTVGVMDAIKDKTDLITSSGISVVEDRVNLSTITMQYNESTTATVNLDENTTSATLVFVVSRPDGTDILTIANGSITRTSTSFTVTITTAVTATLGQYLWSLRDITGGTNRVVTKGVMTVQNAASV